MHVVGFMPQWQANCYSINVNRSLKSRIRGFCKHEKKHNRLIKRKAKKQNDMQQY